MSGKSEPIEEGDAPASPDEIKGRQRSKIAFPYSDFESALQVPQAIYENVGHGSCSAPAQLAPWMRQSAKSSGFRTQLAAARLFGLIDSENSETYRLTELGIQVLDPAQARLAKAESFLRVPLFKALYEKYKTSLIPPTAALEREIAQLGVSEKQKARARQIFESSAEQTGFREQGTQRLVMPAVVVLPPARDGAPGSNGGSGGGAGNMGGNDGGGIHLDLDPLLLALLQKIPVQNERWPEEKRLRWFRTFAMNVSQVYDEDDSPVELIINTAKAEKEES